MYRIKIIENTISEEWNTSLLKSNYSTYFQTSEYVGGNNKIDYFPIFIHIFDDKNILVAQLGIQIIKTSVTYSSPILHKFLKLISGITTRGIWIYGPIIHTKDKKQRLEILQIILDANNQIIKKHNLVFLEGFSPPLDDLIDENYLKIFEGNGYNITKFVTYLTDLSNPIEDIWSRVQKYTKINVKRASKRGIITKELATLDEMKQVVDVHQQWAKTKGLEIINPEQKIKELWIKHHNSIEKFFLAFNKHELIAVISLSFFNNVVIPTQVLNSYSKATTLGGPALTWKAISWGKESNMRVYDITGGPLILENEIDVDNTKPLTHYKRKWGGKETIHYNFLIPGKKIRYQLYQKMFRILKIYHSLVGRTRPKKVLED